MDNPFESDVMDDSDALGAVDEGDGADAGGNAFDEIDAGDGFDGFDAGSDLGDMEGGDEQSFGHADGSIGDDGDAMAVWDAFEEEVADGLDAATEDEFLGRILGGLGRAAGVAARGLGGAAGIAGRVRGLANQAGRISGQVGRVAGRVSPAAQAAAQLARMLGAPGIAGGLQQVAGGAQRVQGWAGTAGRVARGVGGAAGNAQGLLSQLSQLIGGGGDELDDFDAMADLFESGIDEALPAAVALAARAAARGLGFRNVAQLTQPGRRALVRGIAAAARELVRERGPRNPPGRCAGCPIPPVALVVVRARRCHATTRSAVDVRPPASPARAPSTSTAPSS
jgi:hypothetical protein